MSDDKALDNPATEAVKLEPKPESKPESKPENEANDSEGDAGSDEDKKPPKEFVWKIENWSKITERRIISEKFAFGEHEWRLLLFPNGNNVDFVSVYIEYIHTSLPAGWHKTAYFSVSLVNQRDPARTVRRDETHTFFAKEADWGFGQFIRLREIRDESQGFKVNDTVILTATAEVLKESEIGSRRVAGSWNQRYQWMHYDSKKETGFVGLKNQGATCYMNSLLQALYHIGSFRQAVYLMPTERDIAENSESSVPLALQRVFYRLQFSDQGVSTKELTKSFGWDTMDSFTQHDVQELNRVLCDNLEGKMKGTSVEGTIEKHFQGKLLNYIRCVNVDFQSTRDEAFYDLSLNVRGCKDLNHSFAQYIEVETLSGENRYQAEGHGLQDAKKGCWLMKLPPVLELQLKRFEYNPYQDAMCKINDKFIFPPEIDLAEFLSEDADRSVPSRYHLYAVLVHSGDVHGGHYYAFIKPTTGSQWYKFDDDRVTTATAQQAIDDNFGGEEKQVHLNYRGEKVTTVHKKFTNAYMLIYIRENDMPEILAPVVKEMIPDNLRSFFETEANKEDQKRKEKLEAHLYVNIRPVFAKDFEAHAIDHDLVDWNNKDIPNIRLKKSATFADCKLAIIKEHLPDVPPERVRLWRWVYRQNRTCRPEKVISPEDESKELSSVRSMDDLRLFVEVAGETPNTSGAFFDPVNSNDGLMFFKFYDPTTESLSYHGYRVIPSTSVLGDVLPIMRELKQLPSDAPLVVFEEVRPSQVELVKENTPFNLQEIGTGDILVFQHANLPQEGIRFPKAPEFYSYLQNRLVVQVYHFENAEKKEFDIELSKKNNYKEVAQAIADKLGCSPLRLRFYPHNAIQGGYRKLAIKSNTMYQLQDMLTAAFIRNFTPIIYYEPLEIDITELENKKLLRIQWCNSKNEIVEDVKILMARESKVADVIAAVREKVSVKPERPIRLFEVYNSRINRVLRDADGILGFEEHTPLYAEETSEDEATLQPQDRLITVCHAMMDSHIVRPFGVPFMIVVRANEPFSSIRARLQAKLEVEEEEFAKWKFAVCSYGQPLALNDDDIVAKKDFSTVTYLAMFHENKVVKSHRIRRPEKSIKIHN